MYVLFVAAFSFDVVASWFDVILLGDGAMDR